MRFKLEHQEIADISLPLSPLEVIKFAQFILCLATPLMYIFVLRSASQSWIPTEHAHIVDVKRKASLLVFNTPMLKYSRDYNVPQRIHVSCHGEL